jgi:hypothetical protein
MFLYYKISELRKSIEQQCDAAEIRFMAKVKWDQVVAHVSAKQLMNPVRDAVSFMVVAGSREEANRTIDKAFAYIGLESPLIQDDATAYYMLHG